MERMKLNIQLFAVSASLTSTTLSQDTAANTSSVRVTFTVKRTSGTTYWGNAKTVTFTIDGKTYTSSIALPSSSTSASCYVNATITHNSDGTKSFEASAITADTGTSAGRVSASGTFTLATIPRYVSTVDLTLSTPVQETSITYTWKTKEPVSEIKYGTSTSSMKTMSVDGTQGTFTITGLNANTKYTIYSNYKRKDSGLYLTSNIQREATTESYPYAKSMPAFNIGDQLTIGIHNPLGRTFELIMVLDNGNEINVGTYGSSYVIGFNNTGWQNILYNSIPSSSNGKYSIRCRTSSSNILKEGSRYYALENSDTKPIYDNHTFIDTNSDTIAVTRNQNIIVKNVSTGKIDVNFHTQKSAKIKSVSINGQSASVQELSVSGNNTNYKASLSISNITSNNVPVVILDSRGFKQEITVASTGNLINYSKLETNFTLGRGQIAGNMDLSFNGHYFDGSIGSTPNYLILKYRVKEYDEEYTTDFVNITEYSLVGNTDIKNLYSGTGSTYERIINIVNPLTEDGNWDYNKRYLINIIAEDIFTKTNLELQIAKGKPMFMWYEYNETDYFDVLGQFSAYSIYQNGVKVPTKLQSQTVSGLNLGVGASYNLTLPENAIWVEPLINTSGNPNGAGGTLVPIGRGYTYCINTDNPVVAGGFLGIWVSVSTDGLVTTSEYRHCGNAIKGFRIWYLE